MNNKKPLLVFLHGWAFDSQIWQKFPNNFKDKYDILIPNLENYYPNIINRLTEDLIKRNNEQIYIIAWSLGFLIAMAISKKIKFKKIISISALPDFFSNNGIKEEVLNNINKNLDINIKRTLKKFHQWTFYPNIKNINIPEKHNINYLKDTLKLLHTLNFNNTNNDNILYIMGEKDAVLPIKALEDFPDIKYLIYKNASHALFIENEEILIKDILNFFNH